MRLTENGVAGVGVAAPRQRGLDLRRTENGNGLVHWVHVDSTQCELDTGPVFAHALYEPGTIMEGYR